jgi:acyl-CoA synthetase (AMP-forming)/AMP-acid ligase II
MTKMAEGMSMRVISTRSSSSRAELEHLLRESDVVSLSCPLNDATRGLIGCVARAAPPLPLNPTHTPHASVALTASFQMPVLRVCYVLLPEQRK